MKRITNGQVKQISAEIAKRWKFKNHGSYYTCTDTKTGQKSNEGGKYNFASYHFHFKVQEMYLKLIGENPTYMDWNSQGVKEVEERKYYVLRIKNRIVELLCGFKG